MTPAYGSRQRHTIEIFGLKLLVSNAALAELLMMDAREALTTDIRDLPNPRRARELQAEAAEAVPGVVLTPQTLRDQVEENARLKFHRRVVDAGAALGFDAGNDCVWRSRLGFTLLTRAVLRPVSPAAAIHFVEQIAPRLATLAGPQASVLFVTDRRESVEAFAVAIRHTRLQHQMRVVCMQDLDLLVGMAGEGAADHRAALGLLSPAAGIDAGETIALLAEARAAFENACGGRRHTVA